MPDEVVQSTSPIITKPEVLTSEALRPASTDDIMAALDAATGPTARTASTTRRRGRPPGSKNRTPLQKAADSDPELAEKLKKDAEREAKKARAETIEKQVYGELNDSIMTLLIGTFNLNPDMIYLPGKGPVVQKKDERFTDLGNALAIPPNLAHSIGRLAAELEGTGVGQTVSGIGQNSNVGLIVAGGMTAFGIFQYARNLQNVFEKLKPILDARKAAMQSQAQGQSQEQPVGDNVVANSGSVS